MSMASAFQKTADARGLPETVTGVALLRMTPAQVVFEVEGEKE